MPEGDDAATAETPAGGQGNAAQGDHIARPVAGMWSEFERCSKSVVFV